ncbi:MAG: thioesterase family protein [Planctomycetota bacterium]
MGQVFRTQRLVEFADTDMAGIAHFSAFFRWMEAAEHELLRSLGHSVFDKRGDDRAVSFPRVNATCDYRSPARCEDVLKIAVSVVSLGTTSITYAAHFSLEERVVAEGRMTSVCCCMGGGETIKPVPLPAEFAESLRPFAGDG